MPDDTTTSSAPAGGRQFAGQPWWVWAAGGVALVGGYIYLRKKGQAAGQQQAAAGTSTTTAAGSPTGLSWEQFLLFIHDQQSSPRAAPTGAGSPAPAPAPPQPNPPVRRKTPQPPLMSGSYTVKPGDSLASIASRYKISRVELAHANGLGTGAGLRTGSKLKVPGPLRTRAQGGAG